MTNKFTCPFCGASVEFQTDPLFAVSHTASCELLAKLGAREFLRECSNAMKEAIRMIDAECGLRLGSRCTGYLVHDENTPCPVHDR